MFVSYNIKLFLLITTIVCAQQPGTKSLQDRVKENQELWLTDPDKAFSDTEILLEEAIRIDDHIIELVLLGRSCWHYSYRADIENLIKSAQLLEQKGIEYKHNRYKAQAHLYLLDAYLNNHLYEKAIAEYNKAMTILENEDAKDPNVIMNKANANIYLANLYDRKNESEGSLRYLLLASKELDKLNDMEKRKKSQYHNYSNIGAGYLSINIDSAEYYIKKSINLKPENYSEKDPATFQNYYVLGETERLRENYREALIYYHNAEALILPESSSNKHNKVKLFKGLQEVYEALSDTANVNHYRLKLKETELEIAQNKNKSLHKILEDFPGEDNTKYSIGSVSLLLISGLVFFIYRLKRKNKLLKEQERKSEEYLETQLALNSNRGELHKELIEMVKNNAPGFMNEFLKVFPGFSTKLREINPAIREVDIEFCALLMLNMPTKEIARWKNLAPKTVHNSKYQIRKRLNIPDNTDIYYWFSQL